VTALYTEGALKLTQTSSQIERELQDGGNVFHLRAPIQVEVAVENGLWQLESTTLGIVAAGPSQEDALRSFTEDFAVLWEEIAQAPDVETRGRCNSLEICAPEHRRIGRLDRVKSKKARGVRQAQVVNGFREDAKRDHLYYFLYVDGRKSAIHTKISHNETEIGPALLSLMARQLRIGAAQFDLFIDCKTTQIRVS
jgi:hypothetical protein